MGHKKIGKQRRDKYYKLAKESGYRSRAAFKLMQLNRKFEFLQKSKVLVDLCAAPGGWLQVASQHMPVGSLIIGVDLVSIRPIAHALTLQGDITTEKCKKDIQRELKTWLADCVLHDGAPNVGLNWQIDAFTQAQLTLSALKLAITILRRGGTFVTKVFRSKDYLPLTEVFAKLFKKVYCTKPQASRTESAEIFVVCEHFLKPDKIAPELLDPKLVFQETEIVDTNRAKLNILHPEKQKKARAEGYAEGDNTLYHTLNASTFLASAEYIELLAAANEIVLDVDRILDHPLTTAEIKTCCKDIKVLGRREVRELLTWRKKLRDEFKAEDRAKQGTADQQERPEITEIDEEALIDQQVDEAKLEELRETKKKRRKDMREKRKYRDRVQLEMIHPGDQHDLAESGELFSLHTIRSKRALESVAEVDVHDDLLLENEGGNAKKKKSKVVIIDTKQLPDLEEELDDEADLSFDELHTAEDDDLDGDSHGPTLAEAAIERNPLVMAEEDLVFDDEESKLDHRTSSWFHREIFAGINDDDDEDFDIAQMENQLQKESKAKAGQKLVSSEADSQFEEDLGLRDLEAVTSDPQPELQQNGFVSEQPTRKRARKLDPEELALGEMMMHSAKSKRDLIDWGYNRYASNDTDMAPDWFVADEKKHMRKQLPITKEQVAYYRQRLREIDARPIKRVAQAKVRKHKRMVRRMEKARKRAEVIIEKEDMPLKEKAAEMKRAYRAVNLANQKKEVKYVVAKKGRIVGKKIRRPGGVKGPFKVVDPRMKKDMRNRNVNMDRKKTGGKGSKQKKR